MTSKRNRNNGYHRTRERVQQSFDKNVPQYFVNTKGKLERSPIDKDMQALIDSAEYTSLDDIYDRMLVINSTMNSGVDNGASAVMEREGFEDDLSRMLEIDALRDKYAMENPDVANMTHAQMREYIGRKLDDANKHIEKIKKERDDAKKNEAPQESE